MGALLLRIKDWWLAADKTQRLITAVGGGFLIVLLVGTFMFASKPKMVPVFANLSPEDTGSVQMEVENMGIDVNIDQNGNVYVPKDKVAQVRAGLALKGKLPHPGSSGADALSKISPFGDPKVQDKALVAVTESELCDAIQVFDGVETANVQITPAVDSPFEGDKKPALANVTVGERAGSLVSKDEARAMANLVASAVPGLDKSKVTIFTRTGRALWDGEDLDTGAGSANNKLDMEKAEARQKREALQDALNSMLGAGNAIAMVDLTLDVDQVEEVSEKHDGKPIPETSIEEQMTNKGSGSGGTTMPGQAGNDPNNVTFATGAGGGSSSSGYTSNQTRYDASLWPNTVQTTTKRTPGDIKSMAITILVNKTNNLDPTAIASVQTLANSYLGPNSADKAHFSANVVAYPFDTSQAAAAKKAEAAAATSGMLQQALSILPILALIIVGIFVMKSISKLASRPITPMLAMAGGAPGQPALPMSPDAGHPLFSPSSPSSISHEAANRFVLPEVVKQKALEAGISEEQLQAAIEEAGSAGISVEDIPSIKAKINVPLEQIKKMANERPETVAMLVKSWLIEEGIRR